MESLELFEDYETLAVYQPPQPPQQPQVTRSDDIRPAAKRSRVMIDDLEVSIPQCMPASTIAAAFEQAVTVSGESSFADQQTHLVHVQPQQSQQFIQPVQSEQQHYVQSFNYQQQSQQSFIEFTIIRQPVLHSLKQRSRITPPFQVCLRLPSADFECVNDVVFARLADGTSPELLSFRLLSNEAHLHREEEKDNNNSNSINSFHATFHSLTFEQGSRQTFVRLQFHAVIRQKSTGLLMPIQTAASEPFIVCTHTLQWSPAELATLRRIAFELTSRDSISWNELATLLQNHFVHATALERTLSTSDLNFIHQKLLYNSEQITPAQLSDLWRWYGAALKNLVGKPGRSLWEKKFLWGFHTNQQLRNILLQLHQNQKTQSPTIQQPQASSSSSSSRRHNNNHNALSANYWLSASSVFLFAIDEETAELCAFRLTEDYQLVRAEVVNAKLSIVVAVLENSTLTAVLHPDHPETPLLKDRALRDLRPKGSSSSSSSSNSNGITLDTNAAANGNNTTINSSSRKRRESDADSAAGSPRNANSNNNSANNSNNNNTMQMQIQMQAQALVFDQTNYVPIYDDVLL